ncbi:MAG: ABC transporter substrate-binding protein [Rickettsiales bacterium]
MNACKQTYSHTSMRILFVVLLSAILLNINISDSFGGQKIKYPELHDKRLEFATSFAEIVLSVISDQKKEYDERKKNLSRSFSNSMDIGWIAKFVIGRNIRQATAEQKETYTNLYRKFLTKVYVESFAENPDKRINAIDIINVSDTNTPDFTVSTKIKLTNQDVLNVNYLVREDNNSYKVRDISIENVSLINTHRAEFTKLASSNGIAGVIKKLKELLSEDNDEFSLTMN